MAAPGDVRVLPWKSVATTFQPWLNELRVHPLMQVATAKGDKCDTVPKRNAWIPRL
jgi:hypothetical protein